MDTRRQRIAEIDAKILELNVQRRHHVMAGQLAGDFREMAVIIDTPAAGPIKSSDSDSWFETPAGPTYGNGPTSRT